MNKEIRFEPITKDNWEEVLKLEIHPEQKKFAPSPAESLAAAYVKPWDEALDPYAIVIAGKLVGCFYVSYTPASEDNYWIGGFIIDKKYQGKGYGKAALREILRFIPKLHPNCKEIKLTVESENTVARSLYKSLGFGDTDQVNKYGEIIFTIRVVL